MYVCTHGYRRISRSSGSRPRQKVRYTNCKARFTASVVCEIINNAEVLCIKITGQVMCCVGCVLIYDPN